MASITQRQITIGDVICDVKRIYSPQTIGKYYRLLTNRTTTYAIKIEKMGNALYLTGGFPYYYAALQKAPQKKFKCLVHEYSKTKEADRLLRALNHVYLEQSRDWYLYNGFILKINELGWADQQIARRLKLKSYDEVKKYKIDVEMEPFYQIYAIQHKKETLFNRIAQSPLSTDHKDFLFQLAMKHGRKLTQTAVKSFISYIKKGYEFHVLHPKAENTFWDIVHYEDHIQNEYWKGIHDQYFSLQDDELDYDHRDQDWIQ